LITAVSSAARSAGSRAGLAVPAIQMIRCDSADGAAYQARSAPDFEHTLRLIEASGWGPRESLVLALAVCTTLASPAGAAGAEWMSSALSSLGDTDLALDMAGVVFAFNAVNRIADARRVKLEYRFLRELGRFRGWIERRFVSLTGLAYDLAHVHRPKRQPHLVLHDLEGVFRRLGSREVPEMLRRLDRSPLVLGGVSEFILANARDARIRPELWREAIAIAVASRAMSGSCLVPIGDHWLPRSSSVGVDTRVDPASSIAFATGSDLISTCRRYAWQVSNAAYMITDEQIRGLHALGLSDAEVLDLTLAVALFSALAIVEPLILAAVPTDPA
jgi:hypothetical protein